MESSLMPVVYAHPCLSTFLITSRTVKVLTFFVKRTMSPKRLGQDDIKAYRYNEQKTLQWLVRKVDFIYFFTYMYSLSCLSACCSS